MKKQFVSMLALLFSLGGAFTSCSDDDPILAELEVAPATVEISALGGSQEVAVSTNLDVWEVQADAAAAWCTVAKSETDDKFIVTVEEFAEKTDRIANITVISGEDTKTVKVTQKGVQATLEPEKSEVSLNGFGKEIKVKVNASGEWKATPEESADWMEVSKDGDYLVIRATLADAERSGNILLTLDDAKVNVKVTQSEAATEIGDLFMAEDGTTAVGVIINNDKENGYIYVLSKEEKCTSMGLYDPQLQYITVNTNALSKDGYAATQKFMKETDWETKFPAIVYINSLNKSTGVEGWYLPGIGETEVWNGLKNNLSKINTALKGINGMEFCESMPSYTQILTSTTNFYEGDPHCSSMQGLNKDLEPSIWPRNHMDCVVRGVLKIQYLVKK